MPSAYAATVLRTSKRPIPNAMRLPVGALLLTHELLVRVVVALEPAHAVALAAREISDALLLVGPAEIERRDVRARVARPGADLDGLLTLGDLLPDVLLRIERVARLRHVAELHRLADHQ